MFRRDLAAASAALALLAAVPVAAQKEDLKKNPEKAIKQFTAAVERAPEDPESWHNLALAYYTAKKHDDAAKAIAKANELNPGGARSWQLAGAIATERQQGAEAVTAYEKARDLETQGGGAMSLITANGLGKAYLDSSRWADAAAAYKQAYKLVTGGEAGDAGAISNQIGAAYLKAGDVAEAAKWFERAAEKSPDSAAANYNLGMMYRKMATDDPGSAPEAWKQAAGAFKKSADLRQSDALAQFFAGEALLISGRKAEGRPYLERYLSLDPDGKKAIAKFGAAGKTEVLGAAKQLLAENP